MADDLRKGITGAITEGAAAMLDASQGTQFYQQIQDEKKEERARQFALEQLREEKAKLDNENAVNSTNSLLASFTDRVNSSLQNLDRVTLADAEEISAQSQALATRIPTTQNLTPENQEMFATQLIASEPQQRLLVQAGRVNTAASPNTALERFGNVSTFNLNPDEIRLFFQKPRVAQDVSQGEEYLAELLSATPDQLSPLEKQYRQQYDTNFQGKTFSEIALDNPVFANNLLGKDPIIFREEKVKNTFLNAVLPAHKEMVETRLGQLGPQIKELNVLAGGQDQQQMLNNYYSENNIVKTDKGYDFRVPLPTLYTQLFSGLETKISSGDLSWNELVNLQNKVLPIDEVTGPWLSTAIEEQKTAILNGWTIDQFVEKQEDQMLSAQGAIVDIINQEDIVGADIEDPGMDPLTGAVSAATAAGTAGFIAGGPVGAVIGGVGGFGAGWWAASDEDEITLDPKMLELTQRVKQLWGGEAIADALTKEANRLEQQIRATKATGVDTSVLEDDLASVQRYFKVYDGPVHAQLSQLIKVVSEQEQFDQTTPGIIETEFLNILGQGLNIEGEAVGVGLLHNMTKKNMKSKLISFFKQNEELISKSLDVKAGEIRPIINDVVNDFELIYGTINQAEPEFIDALADRYGYDIEDVQDPTLRAISHILNDTQ